MKIAISVVMLLVAFLVANPADAAPRYNLDLPAGSLGQSISVLSIQTGSSIGSVDTNLQRHKVSRLKGRLSLRQALRRLLRNTNLDFVIVNERTARIIPRPAPRKPRSVRKPPTLNPPISPPQKPQTIVVTASKQGSLLKNFAGSAQIIDVNVLSPRAEAGGLEGLLSTLPTTAQTNLGSGRNKLFLRGIADSSLIGTTQSTVGLYLDEARLSYSGPNPDLRSYDQARVEILEGPQGTLFGAGTIGGIVKIMTNKPDTQAISGTIWAGIGASQNGDASFDGAAMLNLPLSDQLALRGVGYFQRNGGYIDDVGRNLTNVNRNDILGGRLALRYQPANDWTFDFNLTHQSNQTVDGQYAERNQPRRERSSQTAQPFESDITSAAFSSSKQWDDFELISSFGYVEHKFESTFDASILSADQSPLIFTEEINSRLFTHETRVKWQSDTGHTGVLGISFLDNSDQVDRDMGPLDDTAEISATKNGNLEAALFGEGTYPLSDQFNINLGGRIVYSRSIAEFIVDDEQELDTNRATVRLLPKASIAWKPDSNGLIYASYQQGFRSGGISIGLGEDNPITQFDSDTIETFEAGVKIGRRADSALQASIAFFYSNWNDIQADLTDEAGFPRTANIGDGRIYGVSLSIDWVLTDRFSLYGRFLANESELVDAADDFVTGDESRLPNIAEMGANGGAVWTIPISDSQKVRLQGDIRYVGASQLGIDPFLSLEQGDYVLVSGSAKYQSNNWSVFLDIDNLLNSQANTFALGNPFTVSDGLQTTPLRPRTLTLGAKIDF